MNRFLRGQFFIILVLHLALTWTCFAPTVLAQGMAVGGKKDFRLQELQDRNSSQDTQEIMAEGNAVVRQEGSDSTLSRRGLLSRRLRRILLATTIVVVPLVVVPSLWSLLVAIYTVPITRG